MKAKYALPMVLAGSVMLSGCWLDDDDNDDNGSTDAATQSILEIAVENANTTILEAAVLEADPSIAELLGGDDQLTVFAPTDAAFEALPEGTVEELLKPENKEQLISILTYHVVPGKVMSSDLTDGMKAATVQGAEITVDIDGGAMVDEAKVIQADIEAANGIIHVIDKVIMPGN